MKTGAHNMAWSPIPLPFEGAIEARLRRKTRKLLRDAGVLRNPPESPVESISVPSVPVLPDEPETSDRISNFAVMAETRIRQEGNYAQSITRYHPACVVVLVDRSDSMKMPASRLGETRAEIAAAAVNKILADLIENSTRRGRVGHYFDVGVFGYGLNAETGEEGVASALSGKLSGRGIVSLPELAEAPLRFEKSNRYSAGAGSQVPIWVEPMHGFRTPLCQAIAVTGADIFDWVGQHPSSFPPIVINITDGFVTDSPYLDTDLGGWVARLRTLATADGPTLLFNVIVEDDKLDVKWFPSSPDSLSDLARVYFDISSIVPRTMIENARSSGLSVELGARGLVVNADFDALIKLLHIGTRVALTAVV